MPGARQALCQGGNNTQRNATSHPVLREFHRELDMESCKFYDTLCNLFEDTLTEQDCVQFFHDIGEAEEKLKERLVRPQAVINFLNAVTAMEEELSELRRKFATPEEDVVKNMSTKPLEAEYVKVRLGLTIVRVVIFRY